MKLTTKNNKIVFIYIEDIFRKNIDGYIYNICIYRLDSNKIDVMLACLGFDQLLFLYIVK